MSKPTKLIKNNCPDCEVVDFDSVEIIQGALKTEEDLDKLEFSLRKRGIVLPFFLWSRDDGTNAIIDGSRRTKVLKGLKAQGYAIDPIPYVPIEASTLNEAKQKILLKTSSYASPTKAGVNSFTKDLKLGPLKKELSSLSFKFLFEAYKKTDTSAQRPREVDEDDDDDVVTGRGSNPRIGLETKMFRIEFENSKDYNTFWELLAEIKDANFPTEPIESVFYEIMETLATTV